MERLVLPLEEAEPHFLQVLLYEFKLHRLGNGTQLDVRFDESTPAIWRRQARLPVGDDFAAKADEYQKALDRFLLAQEGTSYAFADPTFPFRFASGGTLPIVRYRGREYYYLAYREIFPIGWNISNGGCDSRHELLNPIETIERELREEVLVFDPNRRPPRHYLFEWDSPRPIDRPELGIAHRVFSHLFPGKALGEVERTAVPLKWLDGPDLLRIHFGSAPPISVRNCFLNINAEDFGIEVDKVAMINLDESAVVCTGEVTNGQLVLDPVGLFEIERFNEAFLATPAGSPEKFLPDILFYLGERYDGSDTDVVVREHFVPDVVRRGLISDEERKAFDDCEQKYRLCPVTRRILDRYQRSYGTNLPPSNSARPADVFLSFPGEDVQLAQTVHEYLKDELGLSVFFSKETIYNARWLTEINDALDRAHDLIVVSSSPEHVLKEWVTYEWRSFFIDLQSRRKPQDAQIFSFISGFSSDNLPRELRLYEAIPHVQGRDHESLAHLGRLLRGRGAVNRTH